MTIRRRTTAIGTAVAVVAGGVATAAHADSLNSIFGQEQCVLSAVELPAIEGLTVSVEGGQVVDAGQAERIADAERSLAEAYRAWRTAASNEFDQLERLQAAWETLQADEEYAEAQSSLPDLLAARDAAWDAHTQAAAADPAIQASEALREAIDEAPWLEAVETGAEIVVEMDHLLHDAEGERVWEDLTEEEREFSLTQAHALGVPGSTITGLVELDEDDVPRVRVTAPTSEGVWVLDAPGRTAGGYLVHSGWAGESSLRWHQDWLGTQEMGQAYTDTLAAYDAASEAASVALDAIDSSLDSSGYRDVKQGVFTGGEGSAPGTAAPEEYAEYRSALVRYVDALGGDGASVLEAADSAARDTFESSVLFGGGPTPHDVFMEHVTAAIDRAQLDAGSTDGDSLALLTCGSETAVVTLTAPGVEDAVEVTISADGVVTGPAEVSAVEAEIAALAWGSGVTTLPSMAQTVTVTVDVPETPEVPEEPKPEPPTPRTPERPSAPVPPVVSN